METRNGAHCLEADTVLCNGNIVTVDKSFTVVQAVAIRDGKFVAVGSNEQVKACAGSTTKVIDLKGKMVLPGLIDSHNHIDTVGIDAIRPSFEASKTVEDVVDVIGKAVRNARPGEWIISAGGGKVGPEKMASALEDKRFPTKMDLDPVSPQNPVVLHSPHIAIANSRALKLAGITRDTPSPEGGRIAKDPETGEPTGVLAEKAVVLMRNVMPPVTREQYRAAIKKACELYSAVGLTSIVWHGSGPLALQAIRDLHSNGELTVRVYTALTYDPVNKTADQIASELRNLACASGKGFGDDMLKIGGIKMVLDGGAGIGTCLQRFKYVGATGKEWYGPQVIPTDTWRNACLSAAKNDLRVAVHDTGGGAIDTVLKVWEEINKEIPITDKRWVNVHCQFASQENMEQVKRLGTVIPTQTVFLYSMGSGCVRYYGREVADSAIPLRNWLNNGVRIALGSDASINPFDPMIGIWHACARIADSGEVIGPNQRITPQEAITAYTINGTYLSYEENVKGSIESGKLADLVVLDKDILSCPIGEIKNARVVTTMVGGKVVYGAF
jgi:predicted amidohydrolase YtcJ